MGWKLKLQNDVVFSNEHVRNRQSAHWLCYAWRRASYRAIICTHLSGYASTQQERARATWQAPLPSEPPPSIAAFCLELEGGSDGVAPPGGGGCGEHSPVCKARWRWFHRGPPCWTPAWAPGPNRAAWNAHTHTDWMLDTQVAHASTVMSRLSVGLNKLDRSSSVKSIKKVPSLQRQHLHHLLCLLSSSAYRPNHFVEPCTPFFLRFTRVVNKVQPGKPLFYVHVEQLNLQKSVMSKFPSGIFRSIPISIQAQTSLYYCIQF